MRWTPEEDQVLLQLKINHPKESWSKINARFNESFPSNKRTAIACSKRYHETLRPTLAAGQSTPNLPNEPNLLWPDQLTPRLPTLSFSSQEALQFYDFPEVGYLQPGAVESFETEYIDAAGWHDEEMPEQSGETDPVNSDRLPSPADRHADQLPGLRTNISSDQTSSPADPNDHRIAAYQTTRDQQPFLKHRR